VAGGPSANKSRQLHLFIDAFMNGEGEGRHSELPTRCGNASGANLPRAQRFQVLPVSKGSSAVPVRSAIHADGKIEAF
jgi:hypothetical protein